MEINREQLKANVERLRAVGVSGPHDDPDVYAFQGVSGCFYLLPKESVAVLDQYACLAELQPLKVEPRWRPGDQRSWKVGATDREADPVAFNALRFKTWKEAHLYSRDLFMRWLGCKRVEVHPSGDVATHTWVSAGLNAIQCDHSDHRTCDHWTQEVPC